MDIASIVEPLTPEAERIRQEMFDDLRERGETRLSLKIRM
jgi:hypothetical protein